MQTNLLVSSTVYYYEQSASFKNDCPYCHSLVWVKLKRTWWERILQPHKKLCFCRTCRKEFWREKYD